MPAKEKRILLRNEPTACRPAAERLAQRREPSTSVRKDERSAARATEREVGGNIFIPSVFLDFPFTLRHNFPTTAVKLSHNWEHVHWFWPTASDSLAHHRESGTAAPNPAREKTKKKKRITMLLLVYICRDLRSNVHIGPNFVMARARRRSQREQGALNGNKTTKTGKNRYGALHTPNDIILAAYYMDSDRMWCDAIAEMAEDD